MRRLECWLFAAIAIIGFASVASAADIPVKAPILKAPPAAIYNWTGFYVGGNIGYGWGKSDVFSDFADFLPEFVFGVDPIPHGTTVFHPKGLIGGLQAGYNWQFSRNWVGGLETDFQWSGQKDSVTRGFVFSITPTTTTFTGTATGTGEVGLGWLGTLRGRLGFVGDSMPGLLWYGTGGLAYGNVKTSATSSMSGVCTAPCNTFSATASTSDSVIKVGWTVGAGVEGLLSNNWTWKAEYLYVDLGTASGTTVPVTGTSFTGTGGGPFAFTTTYSHRMIDQIVRVGVNYRFRS